MPQKGNEDLSNAFRKLNEDFEISQKVVEQKYLKLEKETQCQIETLKQAVRQAELKAAVSEKKLKELEKQLIRFAQEARQKPVE